MAHYLYRCPRQHENTHTAPIGTAPAEIDCTCGHRAVRVLTAPMLSTANTAYRQAAETAAASAERPAVVSHPSPARSAPPRHTDPRHANLPRP